MTMSDRLTGWLPETTEVEKKFAAELLDAEPGDHVLLEDDDGVDYPQVVSVKEFPGARRVRAKGEPDVSDAPHVDIWVVRGRFVFIVGEEWEPLVMNWVEVEVDDVGVVEAPP